MEIKGKIIEILPEKSGQSTNGEWRKQEYILETDTSYPKKICFMAWETRLGSSIFNRAKTLRFLWTWRVGNIMGVGTLMLKRGRFPKTVWVAQVEMKMETKAA